MMRMTAFLQLLCLTLCVPLIASAEPEPPEKSDCKSHIGHYGFAEFVMPGEGGTHKLTIRAGASAKWSIRNSDYVDWITILDGSAGTGPGTVTIQLEANPGKTCRVGELTIGGALPVYGLPIYGQPVRILQQVKDGAALDPEEEQARSVTWLIELDSFSGANAPQSPPGREYRKTNKKK